LLLACALVLAVTVALFRWGFNIFPLNLKGETPATLLTVVGLGNVQVSLDGSSELRTAQTGLRLYPDDRIITPENAYAELTFFDGTVVRLGERSEILIAETLRTERTSAVKLVLEDGLAWIETGEGKGTRRTLETAQASFSLSPSLIGLFADAVSMFFETSGPGVEVRIPPKGRELATLIISEGQQIDLSDDMLLLLERGEDPYRSRQALAPSIYDLPFVRFNQSRSKPALPLPLPPEESGMEENPLTLLAPREGELATGMSIIVRGRISERVRGLRINGYAEAILGPLFEKEVSLGDEEEFVVEVIAEDADGIEIAREKRTVRRDLEPPPTPSILLPGSGGSIVVLTEPEAVIEGATTSETIAIVVNGYRLQRFEPGSTTWRYIASAELGNLSYGENTYTIIANDRSGNVSEPAEITLIWEGGEDTSGTGTGSGLHVTSPSAESPFETEATELLLEGTAPPGAAIIKVNGYTLQLFQPGSPTWNYILKEEFGNFHVGMNRYVIEARNAAGNVIARTSYKVRRVEGE
jgi:hypothetical protein